MPVRADIVITKPDSPEVLLVAEVKTGDPEPLSSEEQLKAYMARISCPVGLLVTSEEMRFFRNLYTEYGPDSIHLIGKCPTRDLLGSVVGNAKLTESDLEPLVERWLESLRMTPRKPWPAGAR